MGTAISFAIAAMSNLPTLIKAGVDIYQTVNETIAALRKMDEEKRDPTVAEWDALNQHIDANMAKLAKAASAE